MARRTGGFQSELNQATDKRSRQLTRNLVAVALFLIAVGIIVTLVILNLFQQQGKTHFYFIYVEKYNQNESENPFVTADWNLFQRLFLEFDPAHVATPTAIRVQTDGIRPDIERIRQAVKPNDHLVVYFAVKGEVRQQDSAVSSYLKTSVGADNSVSMNNLLSVPEIVREISQIRAKSKLLLFEPGIPDTRTSNVLSQHFSVTGHNRTGDFFRQETLFPWFLAQDLAAARSPDPMWAVIANRTFEQSNVLESLGHSVFAHAVAKSIRQLAEQSSEIDIYQLYQLVSLESRRLSWWDGAANADSFAQVPVLVDCRAGEMLPLATRANQTDTTRQIAWLLRPKPGKPDDDDNSNNAPATMQPTLKHASLWELVLQLEQRTAAVPFSPVDFAPEAWLQFVERLMAHHVSFLATQKVDRAFNDELSRWQLELNWLLHVMGRKTMDEGGPGNFQDEQLREVARRFADYKNAWNSYLPNESQAGTRDELVAKTLTAGKNRDALWMLRFYANGFDLAPDRFSRSDSAIAWLKRVPEERSFSPSAFRAASRLTETNAPNWETPLPSWNMARSHWMYERELRSFVWSCYLRREFPSTEISHQAGPGEDDFRSGLVGSLDSQEGLLFNAKQYVRYTEKLINLGEQAQLLQTAPNTWTESDLPPQVKKVGQLQVTSWPVPDDEPAELTQRRRVAVIPAATLASANYQPPRIEWSLKARKIALQFTAGKGFESSFQRQGESIQLTALAEVRGDRPAA